MELLYLRQEALDKLAKSVDKNISHYSEDTDNEWVEDFFRSESVKRPLFSSEIEMDDIELQCGDDASLDADNAIVLHQALRGKLNAVQATDRRLWVALTHTVFYPYMISRWPVENILNDKGTNGTVTDRYFMSRGFFRNGISRLYWIAEMTVDDTLDDPYEYTRYFISNQDLINQVDGQAYCRNREVLVSCLKALKAAEPLSENQRRLFFQNLCKRGGVTVLDALPSENMDELCKNVMDDVHQMKVIKNGSKIMVQALDTSNRMTFEVRGGKPYVGKTVFRSKPENLYRLIIGKEVEIGKTRYRIIDIN